MNDSILALTNTAFLREILEKVKGIFPEAVIAGGCLRDLDHGVPFKDIDVFVAAKTGMELLVRLMDLPEDFERKRVLNFDYAHWLKGKDETLRCAVTYVYGDYEVQFIGVDLPEWSPEAVLGRIDFGFCRIGMHLSGEEDGGYCLVTTADYLADKEARQMSLLRAENSHQVYQSLRRFKRLSAKYPGHRFRAVAQPDGVGNRTPQEPEVVDAMLGLLRDAGYGR